MQFSADTSTLAPQGEPFSAYWTAKNLNATASSRTATTRPLQEGMILHQDPYSHDGGDGGTDKPLNVFMIANAGERVYNAFKVVHVPPSVNEVVGGALRGGEIRVVALDLGRDPTLVNGSIAVGGPLITQLHSSTTTGGALIASTAATDAATAIAAMEQRVGRALATNSSGDALIRTSFTGIRHI